MKRVLYCIFFLIFFLKCTLEKEMTLGSLPILHVADSLFLYLDYETPNKFTSSQIIMVGNAPHLLNTFFDFRFIKFYDLKTGACTKTIRIEEEGPDRLRELNGSFFLDSIHFFALGGLKSIYFVKSTDKLYIKEIIEPVRWRYPEYLPYIYNNLFPVIELDEHRFILANSLQFRKGRSAFNVVDTSTRTLTQQVIFPDAFIEGFFGVEDFRTWTFTFDRNRQLIVSNFPNLDTLYTYNVNFETIGKYFIESSIKKKPIKKIVKINDYEEAIPEYKKLSKKELHIRIKSNMQYFALLYDEKNDHYYRIVGHPISQDILEYEDPIKSRIRKYTIMVLDPQFNLVTEWSVPYNKYWIENVCFTLYDGYLYIQRKTEEEDVVIFDKVQLLD